MYIAEVVNLLTSDEAPQFLEYTFESELFIFLQIMKIKMPMQIMSKKIEEKWLIV